MRFFNVFVCLFFMLLCLEIFFATFIFQLLCHVELFYFELEVGKSPSTISVCVSC